MARKTRTSEITDPELRTRILALAEEGLTGHQIAKRFSREKIVTPRGGTMWSGGPIEHLLTELGFERPAVEGVEDQAVDGLETVDRSEGNPITAMETVAPALSKPEPSFGPRVIRSRFYR